MPITRIFLGLMLEKDAVVGAMSLSHHPGWLLLLNFEAAVSEFEDETRLVGRLQQPGANYSVHINGCADDLFGDPIKRVLLVH